MCSYYNKQEFKKAFNMKLWAWLTINKICTPINIYPQPIWGPVYFGDPDKGYLPLFITIDINSSIFIFPVTL